jgi:hypothetical protein
MFAMIIPLLVFADAKTEQDVCKKCDGHQVDKAPYAAQVKVLRDSAAALQALNPGLAKGLNDLADKKEEKMKKQQERKDQYAAMIKLLKDSAAALKASNPTLAKELKKISEKKNDEMI